MELRKHQKEAIEALQKINEGIIHLPTGTGKTNIEALSISDNIQNAYTWLKDNNMPDEIPVFVVLAPRILLSNQLFGVIRNILLEKNQDCHYLIVHSGKTIDNIKRMWTIDLPYRQLTSTTSSKIIIEEYNKAKAEKVPMIIFGTYDSSERIVNAKIPVYMLICDEGQYLVSERFGWISHENEENPIKGQFNSYRKYYYTATLKETISDNGLGMNNSNLFGPIIYEKTPLEMIIAGEILRPRMHLVDVIGNIEETDELNKDVNAIMSAFIEHKAQCKTSPKLLVVTKGSEHLNQIVTHPKIQNFLVTRPNLKIFDISSYYHPRINEEVVKRETFLKALQSLTDQDEAIILHIDILSEGIDVPGITGIMPMNMMGLGKFLQTLGRASRLHVNDRKKLYDSIIKYNELEKFIKDYAWIIIPIYGNIGEDLGVQIETWITALRDHGFNANEDVVIKESKGKAIPIPIGGINERDTKTRALFDVFVDIEHNIEEREIADKIAVEDFRLDESIKNMSDEELLNQLV
jgi:superfamily II DNA or RNA helicase